MGNPHFPSRAHRRAPAPPAPTRTPHVPWASTAMVVFLALYARRGDRGALASAAFNYLNLLLLFWSSQRFHLAPPGSAARARIAVWLLTASLTVDFTWKMCALLPPMLTVAAWAMAVATVGGGFYLLVVHVAERNDP